MEKLIKLSGRVDSSRIAEVEKRVFDEIGDFDGDLIIDTKGLDYISSVGLRLIMKLRKSHNVRAINCNSVVYEVFALTGFTEMMDIYKEYRKISIDGCEKIGDGFYGMVYRLSPETIVKVYKQPDSLDMILREKKLSKKAFVMGIPTAIPFEIVKVGNLYGSVFELLNAKPVTQLISNEKDLDYFCKSCVEILTKIHNTVVKDGELPSRKQRIFEQLESCKTWLSEDVYNKLKALLNSIPETNTMLHCDFHIKNIMKQGDEYLLIDMDTLSVGHPIFEFAAIYAAYIAFASVNKNNTMEFFGISLEKCREIWNKIFEGYFSNKSQEERSNILEKLATISFLEVLFLRTKFPDPNNKYLESEIKFCQQVLYEKANKLENLSF